VVDGYWMKKYLAVRGAWKRGQKYSKQQETIAFNAGT
jgi:hypothetical protein